MANITKARVSTVETLFTLGGINARRSLAAVATILFAVACAAQNQDQSQPSSLADSQNAKQSTSSSASETIPAGTRLRLVLSNPIFSNTTHRGDEIQAQTSSPITIGDHVVIPGGIFVQGKVDKLSRQGDRSTLSMQSIALIFPDGYVANVAGPLNIETEEGTAWANPSARTKAGMFIAPMAGLGLGALIGSAAHTTHSTSFAGNTIISSSPKGLAIGSMVGLAAGGVVSLVLLTHSHQFFVDAGAPMDLTLAQPFTVAADQVQDSNRVAQQASTSVPIPAPRPRAVTVAPGHGTCFTPGLPGTPSTVIPGIPGPNGVPGPPTVIPGTPPIPGTAYPCP